MQKVRFARWAYVRLTVAVTVMMMAIVALSGCHSSSAANGGGPEVLPKKYPGGGTPGGAPTGGAPQPGGATNSGGNAAGGG